MMVWLCFLLLGTVTLPKLAVEGHPQNIRGFIFGQWDNSKQQPSSTEIKFPSINVGIGAENQMLLDSSINADYFCQGPCLDHWINYMDNCYLYVPTPSTKAEAERFCKSAFNRAQLARIEDIRQNAFVVALAKSMDKKAAQFWTEQSDVKGWNNQRGLIFGISGCFSLGIGGLGLWGNTDCNSRFPFVCSYTPTLSP
ncbi:snaclec 5-like [Rhinatrema bivittatum]|uniref:snaclec 5-like n=1 Tax=Rhinatrema bivittatum TaxID=194408 RepID=UPI00112A4110|nr:snaclec 5-like [Rhinatrema bivittatum]XP_029430754.1 snaclec 5-like [Rhinatrema bivittatum]XP_029430755.1 snaclec 5-like [Rhinatrema bivittatum]XP_029430757.1 snaclec 5-like [Rhinatrema bivittatum]